MKKIFKALALTVAASAMCAGIALSTGCTGGNGTYEGEFHYPNAWNPSGTHYGMKVRVTVENNIITKVVDITKGEYIVVSDGWEDKATWNDDEAWLLQQYEGKSVADILAMKVNLGNGGQPYGRDKNTDMETAGILITNATQGSGRLLLAVQNALGKDVSYGWIEAPDAE